MAFSRPYTGSIPASDITSGTVATARLGSGTADSTTFLRGDQTWATAGIAYEYSWPADATLTYVPGTYQTIHTTSSLATGRYRIRTHINHIRAAASAVTQRIQAGTATLAGATNDPLGFGYMEGAVTAHVSLSATSPWTTTTLARASSNNQAAHCFDITFEVTSAGTVVLQQTFGASNDITVKKSSLIQIWKVA